MMAVQIVPCDAALLFWSQTTTLDGVSYLLTFRYNSREAAYYLNIGSADGLTDYVVGAKLVVGFALLRPWATPPGELVVLSGSDDDSPPRLGDLADGARCTLLYIPQADLFAPGNTVDPQRFPGFLV
jgi:hypothetical protein